MSNKSAFYKPTPYLLRTLYGERPNAPGPGASNVQKSEVLQMGEQLNGFLWNSIGYVIWGGIAVTLILSAQDIFNWSAPMWMNESAWVWFESHGWIEQDMMAEVYADAWTTGEYKECINYNEKAGDSSIDLRCGSDSSKLFKVRFNTRAHNETLPHGTVFNWMCRKSDNDPAIICQRKAEID
jgi:hypothetical protein